MNDIEIFRGNELAPGEQVVWRGAPGVRGVARDVFHLRGAALYFVLLWGFDAYEAWAKELAPAKAVHDSVPLAVITGLVFLILGALAWLTGRTTRYTVTDRRVILHYGIAMPATLSLPFSQIAGAAAAVNDDHSGDVALTLKSGNRMPYLKLWPHARPWHTAEPQPMLRRIPQAGLVASLLVRALQAAEQARTAAQASVPVPAAQTAPAMQPTLVEVAA